MNRGLGGRCRERGQRMLIFEDVKEKDRGERRGEKGREG
jgi:hypothetical protein